MARKQQAEELVQVRALMPLWGASQVVPVGTVYGLPPAAATMLAEMGMVALLGDPPGSEDPPSSEEPPDGPPSSEDPPSGPPSSEPGSEGP